MSRQGQEGVRMLTPEELDGSKGMSADMTMDLPFSKEGGGMAGVEQNTARGVTAPQVMSDISGTQTHGGATEWAPIVDKFRTYEDPNG
jgi:hypothetical protein